MSKRDESNKQRFNSPQGWLKTNTLCRLGLCGMLQAEDETHCWGECSTCGKVAGVVSREAIRRYMDAEPR